MDNMWSTVEASAWSRDFDYENYVLLHKKVFPKGTPFSEETYKEFCTIFHNIMERSFKNDKYID